MVLLKEEPTPLSFGPSVVGATATPLPGGQLLNVSVSLKNAQGPSRPRRSSNSTQFPSTCWNVPFDVFGLECGC